MGNYVFVFEFAHAWGGSRLVFSSVIVSRFCLLITVVDLHAECSRAFKPLSLFLERKSCLKGLERVPEFLNWGDLQLCNNGTLLQLGYAKFFC